ncbi:MAG: hypothetical protein ABJE10_10930 [bacterium]
MHCSRPRAAFLLTTILSFLAACESTPVAWDDASSATQTPSGSHLVETDTDPPHLTPPSLACPGSLALGRIGSVWHAVWWSPKPDSSALLVSAQTSDEGKTWSAIAPVDTTDRGVSGCRRAAPALAADSASGYVHVTYAMVAPEGPGIFFSHSMDGGKSFHAPVPILYGERLGLTSVAADADRVAVAFEDPNSGTPRIGLALSRTMGHIFEDRILPVSDDNGAATHPFVAVHGRRLTVVWQQHATANGQTVVRTRNGTLH